MLVGAKALVIVGGESAASVAEAVRPVPPLVELTAPVVLTRFPAAVADTLTEIVQLLLAATEPPLRLIEVDVEVAPLTVPPQLFESEGVVATCRPVGKLSLTARPVRVTVLPVGFVMVSVIVVFEPVPTGMLLAANDLVMVGGISTARVAEAVPPVPPFVELTLPVVLV